MIFLLFIIIPIIEISIFITVGSNIGVLNTIAIILVTALVGIFLPMIFGLYLIVKPTAFAIFWSRFRPQSPLKTSRGEQ